MEASFHVRLIGTFEPDVVCAPAEARRHDLAGQ